MHVRNEVPSAGVAVGHLHALTLQSQLHCKAPSASIKGLMKCHQEGIPFSGHFIAIKLGHQQPQQAIMQHEGFCSQLSVPFP